MSDAPPFDPNQPFEPVAADSKPAFDPDQPHEAVAASSGKPAFDPNQSFDPVDSGEGDDSIGRNIGAGIEGLAQGVAGPLATGAELGLSKLGVPGLSAEDQNKRAADFPIAHGVGEAVGLGAGLFTGTGEAGLIASAAEHLAPEAVTVLGKVGSGALKGAIASGLFQGSDEMSKAMLGQGDQTAPVSSALANIGAAGLFGGATGGLFGASNAALDASSKLKIIEESKVGSKIRDFLAGIGDASAPGKFFPEGSAVSSSYQKGQDLYNKTIPMIIKKGADAAAGYGVKEISRAISGDHDSPLVDDALGIATAVFLGPKIESLVGKTLTPAAQKLIVPFFMKALSTGQTSGLLEAMDHASSVAKGAQKVNKAMGNLFTLGAQKAYDDNATERDREKIKKFIDAGGTSQQIQNQVQQNNQHAAPPSFAEGGVVAPILQETNGIGTHFPAQAMLMASAKGRISNYLGSLKPQKNMAKLPYDADNDQAAQEKKYNKAIDIAASPLSILNKVKDGSLTPDELGHFTSMFPEMHGHLSKEITKKISGQQLNEERPHYKTRQGLSMFLGAPLDSSFTPTSIMAAQNVFAQKQAAASPPGATKKSTSKMGEMSKQLKTGDQAAASRQTDER